MHARSLVVPAVVAVGLLLAACGGKGSPAGASARTATTVAPTGAASASATGAVGGTTGSSGADRRAAFQAYQQCLAQQGITLPTRPANAQGNGQPGNGAGTGSGTPPSFDPNSPPGSFPQGGGGFGLDQNDPKVQAAEQACASLRPQGGFGARAADPKVQAAVRAYESCLSDHGVTIPTTTTAAGPTGGGGLRAINALRNDPKFADANKVCEPLIADVLPARSTATTTSVG